MYSGQAIEDELKGLIAGKIEKNFGFKPSLDEIYLTIGGIGGLFASLMSLLDKGDEAIYFDPSYPLHLSQIHIAQAKPVFVPYRENEGWRIDLDLLKKRITPKTKVIILTNPNNPTGTVLSESEVSELARIVLKHNLILILDEAYEFLTYDKPFFSPLKLLKLKNNIILSRSFSKEYAMTGWRIGYLYAKKDLIAKINDIHFYFSIGGVTPSIVAAIAALSDPRGKKAKETFMSYFIKSRKTICERLDRLNRLFAYVKPEGAYYVFPKIISLKVTDLDFAKMLIDEARVITIPGMSMGPSGKGHIRMSFATNPDTINAAFDRIDLFAKKHNLL
jgi:aminotransferase